MKSDMYISDGASTEICYQREKQSDVSSTSTISFSHNIAKLGQLTHISHSTLTVCRILSPVHKTECGIVSFGSNVFFFVISTYGLQTTLTLFW